MKRGSHAYKGISDTRRNESNKQQRAKQPTSLIQTPSQLSNQSTSAEKMPLLTSQDNLLDSIPKDPPSPSAPKSPVKTPAVAKPKATFWQALRAFPLPVFFIIGNEFCERFAYYGMKAVLPMYLTGWLGFSENTATTIIHSFNFSAYFFTIFGGIMSDSVLGRFYTIFIFTAIYVVGMGSFALTSIPGVTGIPPHWWGMAVGLILMACGTGGIKPVVSTFGGDQFDVAQEAAIDLFFSIFYFSVNLGSFISMLITPIFRQNVHCFGQKSCYPLALGVPAILMACALAIFLLGWRKYKYPPRSGNVMVRVSKAVGLALWTKTKRIFGRGVAAASAVPGPSHWIYLAREKYPMNFLADVEKIMAVLKIGLPMCLFWALYDQQSSRWTFQAAMMNPMFMGIRIKPEQMGIINAVLILVMIPLFDMAVYPLLKKLGAPMRPITRMFWGMILGVVSFIVAAGLQYLIDAKGTFAPNPEDPMTQMCVSGCVHVLWQIPQYIIITAAEILLSITGMTFSYSQAPDSMKSVCQAFWLLTIALGNLVVIVVNEIDLPGRFHASHASMWNFILWAGILTFGTVMFHFASRSFKDDGPLPHEIHLDPATEKPLDDSTSAVIVTSSTASPTK